ncbi:hypothetical protein HAX54_037587 [Datura stramonium]|uniref:Uncharacterized protein n=1 Tax=Datura stramonium TaxID=4076 RepID=A0ABS8VK40_DATST|nr:hypothetical protein [Datura stramonium]
MKGENGDGSDGNCLIIAANFLGQICSSSGQPVKKRRLTQKNLFQLWGLENTNHVKNRSRITNWAGDVPLLSTSTTRRGRVRQLLLLLPAKTKCLCSLPIRGFQERSSLLTHSAMVQSKAALFHLVPRELGTEYSLKGIKVTMLDANHCPGAALIHFRLPNGQCVNSLCSVVWIYVVQRVVPDVNFWRYLLVPSKEDVLEFAVGATRRYLSNQPKPLWLLVHVAGIRKEHVYFAISKALGFLRPEKIIPTVNVGKAVNRAKMQSCFQQWLKA